MSTFDKWLIVKLVGSQRCHVHTFVNIEACGCQPDATIFAREAIILYCDAIGRPSLADQVA